MLDVFDVLAAIFGILFTIRKLDAARRNAADFPHVEPAQFEAWQNRERSIYSLGSLACLLKIVLDLAFVRFLVPHLGGLTVPLIGATIDLTWLGIVVTTLVRGSLSRRERKRLGIVLE